MTLTEKKKIALGNLIQIYMSCGYSWMDLIGLPLSKVDIDKVYKEIERMRPEYEQVTGEDYEWKNYF